MRIYKIAQEWGYHGELFEQEELEDIVYHKGKANVLSFLGLNKYNYKVERLPATKIAKNARNA